MYIFNDVNKEKVLEIPNLVQPTPKYIERWLNGHLLLLHSLRLRIYFDPKNYGLESKLTICPLLCYFLVRVLQCTETRLFSFVMPMKI